MPIAVEMPKMSDTMEEGVLVSWLAEEGDRVSAGDIIAQVETDKATMDLEVYDDGVLLKKVIGEEEAIPIGGLIAVLGEEGESPDEIIEEYQRKEEADVADASGDGADVPEEPVEEDVARETAPEPVPAASEDGGRVKASPLARRMAEEAGLSLASITGSGPEGRVVRKDVEAAASAAPPAAVPAAVPAEGADVRISQMRKTIAKRLAQSKFTSPHFYLTVDVDMERAVAARSRINAPAEASEQPKISYNDFITKACATALRRHPMVNASWVEDEGVIRQHGEVHVAVAVAIEEGLITPVIRNADRKGLAQIAAETRDLAARAREGTLDPSEYSGSTFSTSNLGMFGIEEFTAIINPPNACILAIGAIRDEAVVRDGDVVPGKRMKLTLSCDHRIVDGARGAEFLGDVKGLLEEPVGMLL